MRLKENKCYSLQSVQDSNHSWQPSLKSSPKVWRGEKNGQYLRLGTFLCNMAEITELGLENEDGSFPLLHCAFDTISVDILQLN